ncbi:MAG: hypothetical protein SVX43_06615 [Cyanobacteriota bacterium]|nr:hypothetical protein [Cyanobacteriota bacterium]
MDAVTTPWKEMMGATLFLARDRAIRWNCPRGTRSKNRPLNEESLNPPRSLPFLVGSLGAG